jgi:hypothetical protein
VAAVVLLPMATTTTTMVMMMAMGSENIEAPNFAARCCFFPPCFSVSSSALFLQELCRSFVFFLSFLFSPPLFLSVAQLEIQNILDRAPSLYLKSERVAIFWQFLQIRRHSTARPARLHRLEQLRAASLPCNKPSITELTSQLGLVLI